MGAIPPKEAAPISQ